MTSSEGHRAAMARLDRIEGMSIEQAQRAIDTDAARERRERQPAPSTSQVDGFLEQLDAAVARQNWKSISTHDWVDR
jgi:hypothetical protein